MKYKIPICFSPIVFFVLFSASSHSQERGTEKAIFLEPMSNKYKSQLEYALTIGYKTNVDREVYFEFSGGPSKINVSEIIPVKSGYGRLPIKLGGDELPPAGKGYRLLIALRDKGKKDETATSLTIINDIELVADAISIANNASFSVATPNSVEVDSNIKFTIDYLFVDENLLEVTIWDGEVLVSSSERSAFSAGSNSVEININLPNKWKEGSNYRYILTFGSAKDFINKTTKSEEIVGVTISKPIVFIPSELNEKSIPLYVNNKSTIIELPGDPIYKSIKVIDKNGKVVRSLVNSNSVNIENLGRGNYFIVTNSGYFFKFTKDF